MTSVSWWQPAARQFLVPNLPPLGFTPSYNTNPTLQSQFNARSEQFNVALDSALDSLAAGNLGLMFYRLDVSDLFMDALADPATFGLTNVTNSAAPGLVAGSGSYDTGQIVPNPHEYLFWDDVHPTATVHAILAERARMLLIGLPGDYNEDGAVDAADFTLWRMTDLAAQFRCPMMTHPAWGRTIMNVGRLTLASRRDWERRTCTTCQNRRGGGWWHWE